MKQILFQEDPNLEVLHQAVFTWEIANWRKMERRTHSPVFTCGDSPWYVAQMLLQFVLANGIAGGYYFSPTETTATALHSTSSTASKISHRRIGIDVYSSD
jgi:hypothetical protein